MAPHQGVGVGVTDIQAWASVFGPNFHLFINPSQSPNSPPLDFCNTNTIKNKNRQVSLI